MFQSIEQIFPEGWPLFVKLLLLPFVWIPSVQSSLVRFSITSDFQLWAVLKWIFILLPSLLFIVACWCAVLSLYTIPFRRNRNMYVATFFISCWDSLRACWLFWTGAVRFVWLTIGWTLSLIKLIIGLVFEITRQIFYYPFVILGNIGRQYFRTGIPWIAVILTLTWIFLEGTIFTYVLSPTISELLSGLVGAEIHKFLNPMLFLFLIFLIGGSFACLQGIADAMREKKIGTVIQMLVWELFVIMVEVLFLYRDLVDAVTPWIAQQTNEQFKLGLFGTIGIAFFAWIGIRAMTWFLFARYGTSTLIAIIARKPLKETEPAPQKQLEVSLDWTKTLIENFKSEINWFHAVGKELLESLALPTLQVIASAINFCMVLFTSRPIFSLPFKHIEEVMETKELLRSFEMERKNKAKED